MSKKKKGFAHMKENKPRKLKKISRAGGLAVSANREHMRAIALKRWENVRNSKQQNL